MMFKKGSFEIGGTIYPVAIKVNILFSVCLAFVEFIYLDYFIRLADIFVLTY